MNAIAVSPVGADTSVSIRFLTRDDDDKYDRAKAFFGERTRTSPAFVTHATLAEIFWVLRRGYRFTREECLKVVRRLVRSEAFEFEDGEGVVRAIALAEEGADFADALIQSTMEQFMVEQTVTFDARAAESLGWRAL